MINRAHQTCLLALAGFCFGWVTLFADAGQAIGTANKQSAVFNFPTTSPVPPVNAVVIPLADAASGYQVLNYNSTGVVLLKNDQNYARWKAGQLDVLFPAGPAEHSTSTNDTLNGVQVTTRSIYQVSTWMSRNGNVLLARHSKEYISRYDFANWQNRFENTVVHDSLDYAFGSGPKATYDPDPYQWTTLWDGYLWPSNFDMKEATVYGLDDNGVAWTKLVSNYTKYDGGAGDAYNLSYNLFKLNPATRQKTPTLFDLTIRGNSFNGVSSNGTAIGTTSAGNYVGTTMVDYQPIFINDNDTVIGLTADNHYKIYFADGRVAAVPDDVIYPYFLDAQDRLYAVGYLDVPLTIIGLTTWALKRDADGKLINPPVYESASYQPINLPAGWTTAQESAPAGWTLLADNATYADKNGVQTTGPVMMVSASLAVDANRDGTIKLPSEDSTDATSSATPFRFWINDDIDGFSTVAGETTVQDSLNPSTGTPNSQQGIVTCARDLENFTRLWLSIGGLSQAISSGQITVGLEWHSNTGDAANGWGANDGAPAINIYEAAPKHGASTNTGGTDYLTDLKSDPTQETSYDQINGINPTTGNNNGQSLGPVAKGQPFYFRASEFANLTDANPKTYFLFEGVARGMGRLVITLNTGTRGNYTKIGEGGAVYMDLKNIKELYERWTVGDGPTPGVFAGGGGNPNTPAGISQDRLPAGVQGLQYSSGSSGLSIPTDANGNKYILFVHGWNMPPWEKDAFAETMLKRLYWQGYKGKFGTFEWPTTYSSSSSDNFNKAQQILSYDDGEYSAWKSAVPLEQLLTTLHGAYGGNVYLFAHSMGNVVAGEALRIAGQSGAGQLVNTYVASQAAVAGHCYDPSLTGTDLLNFSGAFGPYTPDIHSNWLATASAAVQAKANFYNVNDYALSYWQLDQKLKPDIRSQVYYYASSDLTTVQDLFKKSTYPDPVTAALIITSHTGIFPTQLVMGNASNVHDRYEILAYDAQPRSLALGAVPDVSSTAFATSQNLPVVWPADTFAPDNQPQNQYAEHQWHSAEFRFTNADQEYYWQQIMLKFGNVPNPLPPKP